jgi:hypothetical protein
MLFWTDLTPDFRARSRGHDISKSFLDAWSEVLPEADLLEFWEPGDSTGKTYKIDYNKTTP